MWNLFTAGGIQFSNDSTVASLEVKGISPYSARMQENTDQKNSEYGIFHAVVFRSLLSTND